VDQVTRSDEVEKQTLLAVLSSQRRHVLGILEGLDEVALRRPVLPSGWSCLGLVQHLARDDERFWFSGTIAGDTEVVEALMNEIGSGVDGWAVDSATSANSVLEEYRVQCEVSDRVLAAVSVEDAPAWWPDELFGDFRLESVREVLLHVIAETATHAGHLDAAREILDGRTWLVL